MKKIYGYSYGEFKDLPEETADAVFKEAFKRNDSFVEKFFEDHPEFDWVMIAGKSKNIIYKGTSRNEPTSDEIEETAKKINMPIFTFSRPTDTEEYICHREGNEELVPDSQIA